MRDYREVSVDIGLHTIDGQLYMTAGAYQSFFDGLHQVVTAAAERQFNRQAAEATEGDELMTLAQNRRNLNFFIDVMVFGQVESASSLLSEIVCIRADKDYSSASQEESQQAISALLGKAKAQFLETTEEIVNQAVIDLNEPMFNIAWNFVKSVVDGIEFGVKHPTELTPQG